MDGMQNGRFVKMSKMDKVFTVPTFTAACFQLVGCFDAIVLYFIVTVAVSIATSVNATSADNLLRVCAKFYFIDCFSYDLAVNPCFSAIRICIPTPDVGSCLHLVVVFEVCAEIIDDEHWQANGRKNAKIYCYDASLVVW